MKRLALIIFYLLMSTLTWGGSFTIDSVQCEMNYIRESMPDTNNGLIATVNYGYYDITGDRCHVLWGQSLIEDSLANHPYIGVDSLIFFFQVYQDRFDAGDTCIFVAYPLKRAWMEGNGTTDDSCGSDWAMWNDTVGDMGGCGSDSGSWGTAGCLNTTTDYDNTLQSIRIDGFGWSASLILHINFVAPGDTIFIKVTGATPIEEAINYGIITKGYSYFGVGDIYIVMYSDDNTTAAYRPGVTVYYTQQTMSQTLTAIDTNYADIGVRNDFTYVAGCIADSSKFQITSNDWSSFTTVKVTSPSDPQDTGFYSLEDTTEYKMRVISFGCETDTSNILTIYTRSEPPDSTPDSLMTTTWYTERYDPAGYGYSNPDPNIVEQGLVTLEPSFSVRAGSQDSIWAAAIQIHGSDSTDGDSFWYSGIFAFADDDTIDGGERTPKIAFPDTVGADYTRRFRAGREYFIKMQLYSGADTTASGWSAWGSFMGVSTTDWWDENYLWRNIFWFDSSHSALNAYTPMILWAKTGNGTNVAYRTPRDRGGDICYYDGYTYVCGLDTASIYDLDTKGYCYFLAKYDNATQEIIEKAIIAPAYGDNHAIPALTVAGGQLHIFIGGHNGVLAKQASYMVCDSFVADSGFVLSSMRSRCDTATAAGPDSGFINENAEWVNDELKGWYIWLRPGEDNSEDLKILANHNDTLWVESDWTIPPAEGDNYFINYPNDPQMSYSTYPSPVTVGDSVYIFFRHYGNDGEDSTGDADGTHSTTTLEDDGKNWTVNCFTGWMIMNTTQNETSFVESNIADRITITGTWTAPEDNDSYKIYTPNHGFLCYIRLDPYADSIGGAFSDRQYVINYNDHPEYIVNKGGSIYAYAFHNDLNDNRDVYVGATLWNYYGTNWQGGSAITAMKSTLDDGWFSTWTNVAGDTIGYAVDDKFYHADSTINKAACDLVDVATDSTLFGALNQSSSIVADTNGNVYLSYSIFPTDEDSTYPWNLQLCALYTARWYNDAWDKDCLTSGDSLINFRMGNYQIIEPGEWTVLGSIWDSVSSTEYTAEIKKWSATLNTDDLQWVSEMLTKNSGHGTGRIVVEPIVHPGTNKLILYQRDELTILLDGTSWPYMQLDGDDARIVIGNIGVNSTVTAWYDRNRRPVDTFGSDSTALVFNHFGGIYEDSICAVDERTFAIYYKNRIAVNPPNTRVHGTQGIYNVYDGFEEKASGSTLNSSSYWIADTGMIYNYFVDWTEAIWEGKKYAKLNSITNAKFNSTDIPILATGSQVGVHLYRNGNYGQFWLELWGDNNIPKKMGLQSGSIIYDKGYGDGWELSDTAEYVGYNTFEFMTGATLPTGALELWGYADGRKIFSSDITDTFDTGVSFWGGHGDSSVTYNGGWGTDALIGYWLKWTSGSNKDTIREIIDNTSTIIYFDHLENDVAQYDSFAIWDTTVGIYLNGTYKFDSVMVRLDTLDYGETVAGYFDGFYIRKCYESQYTDPIELIKSVEQVIRQNNAQVIFIGGD